MTLTPPTNESQFKIEPAIAIPPDLRRSRKFPFHEMKIGDSFFALSETVKPIVMRNAASDFSKRNEGWFFVTRKMRDSADRPGVRVWRVAEDLAKKETNSTDGKSLSNPMQRPAAT